MGRKASKSTPVVIRGILYTEDEHTGARVDSPQWELWLAQGETFHVNGWTVRQEKRRGSLYWYGVRKIDGRVVKVYIGKLPTADKLAELAGDTPRVTDTP